MDYALELFGKVRFHVEAGEKAAKDHGIDICQFTVCKNYHTV